MARRTQAERSDVTTARLVGAAHELFGGNGYAATSIDTISAAAGVTKGAVYHHFGSKIELFRAVFIREQQKIAARLEYAAAEEDDPWEALHNGVRTFLEHCLDPGFRQIVLLDAPSLMGWEAVRELEHGHTLRVLLAGLRLAGGGAPETVAARAQLVFSLICEGGMLLARSPNPAVDLPPLAADIDAYLETLRSRSGGGREAAPADGNSG
ncbi:MULTISPECIES: TetR/AcrR family transcriptional regulator [Nonomuraea]|uniref:TetR/AcrR family transcriptional regulator n=1 Tax=Nonomuraea ferruginea TaxID=46174 RepID=A0ABT4T6C2_9ACTN|nr:MULTISPECIES: TetR/AcrR family transcriptional regulator [Nonomuraea]MDA0645061.1 TetR/AcrR family transcriptional regulator [Nonomuraea ferruginea]